MHYKKNLLTLFLVSFQLFSLNTIGQSKLTDLEMQLNTAKGNSDKKLEVETYIQLGDYYVKQEKNINKGQRFYRRSSRNNKDNEFADLSILFNRQYARSFVLQNKYEDALTHYEEALKLAKANKLKNYIRNLNQEIDQFKIKLAKIRQAEKELDELKSLKDDEAIARLEEKNTEEALATEHFFTEINQLSKENQLQQIKLRFTENELDKKELKIQLLDQFNKAKTAEIEKSKTEIALKNAEIEKKEIETKRQQNIILFFIVGSLLLLIIILIVILNYSKLKKLNLLLSEKNNIIKEKNKEMTDSLNYAQRIQEAILLGSNQNRASFPEHFIFNQPKNIVSGDFFWSNKTKDNKIIWAVVDCTGHGVPGAFMSIIGARLLNEIVLERGISDPGEILDEMKSGIIDSLNQDGEKGESQDGMDMALCVWDPETHILEYAGANNSIYIFRKNINSTIIQIQDHKYKTFENDLLEIKANRSPIGFYPYNTKPFDTIKIQLHQDDIIYASSDGFQDQFGGSKNKKYTTKRMKHFMTHVSKESFNNQSISFKEELNKWKGGFEQIDDVCIVGVKV
jgi:serine phosphatase RsbU (regulator of sigma subunit)